MTTHIVRGLASGEYSCSCGAIWDRDEGDECPSFATLPALSSAKVVQLERTSPRAEELIACLEAEIVKRDARVVELEGTLESAVSWDVEQLKVIHSLNAELAALKAQPSAGGVLSDTNLTIAVDAAMVEMQNLNPPLRRSECARLIRSALESLNPCRAQAASDGYVMVPVEPLMGLMSHNDRDTRITAERQLLAAIALKRESGQ